MKIRHMKINSQLVDSNFLYTPPIPCKMAPISCFGWVGVGSPEQWNPMEIESTE